MRRKKSSEIRRQPMSPPTHDEDPLLTLEEVARQIGKTGPTIGRWVNDGLLECIRLPSGLRAVRQSTVNAFLGGSAIKDRVGK